MTIKIRLQTGVTERDSFLRVELGYKSGDIDLTDLSHDLIDK